MALADRIYGTHINMEGLQIKNHRLHNVFDDPDGLVSGIIWFDETDDYGKVYDGFEVRRLWADDDDFYNRVPLVSSGQDDDQILIADASNAYGYRRVTRADFLFDTFPVVEGYSRVIAQSGIANLDADEQDEIAISGDGVVLQSVGATAGGNSLTMNFLNQSANLVFAGPSSGAATTPTFRRLVDADMPATYDPTNWDLAYAHITNVSNPHSVTYTQVGAEAALGNPTTDGYHLASTAAGSRYWTDPNVIGGNPINSNIISPGLAQDGDAITWNNTTGEYELTNVTGSSGVTVAGTPAADQIAIWVTAASITGVTQLTTDFTTNSIVTLAAASTNDPIYRLSDGTNYFDIYLDTSAGDSFLSPYGDLIITPDATGHVAIGSTVYANTLLAVTNDTGTARTNIAAFVDSSLASVLTIAEDGTILAPQIGGTGTGTSMLYYNRTTGEITYADAPGTTSLWQRTGTSLHPATSGDDVWMSDDTERILFGDGDTYIYESADDRLRFYVGGSQIMHLSDTYAEFDFYIRPTVTSTTDIGGTIYFWQDMYVERWFVEDVNTYIYKDASDNLVFVDNVWGSATLTELATDTIYTHPNHTGQVTSTGDGATALTVTAITAQPELTIALDVADELLVNDGGVLKRMDIGVIEDYMQDHLTFGSGDGSVTEITVGNGMVNTVITTTGSVVMGTPTTLSPSTINQVTTSSHTHNIDGYVEIVGVPVLYQVGVWNSATGLTGDTDLLWDGTDFTVSGSITLLVGATVDTIETTLTDDDTHLATSGAVYDAIAAMTHITVDNQAQYRVITATATPDVLNAEQYMTFDGTTLLLRNAAEFDQYGPFLTIGADDPGHTSRTTSITKTGRLVGPHYNTAEEDVQMIGFTSNAANNTVWIGGGNNLVNAATRINFYTAANQTTITGINVGRFDSTGFLVNNIYELTTSAGVKIYDQFYLPEITGTGTGTSVLRYNRTTGQVTYADGFAGTFLSLSDTPANYSGAGGYFVRVNAGATGLEFTSVAAQIQDLTDLANGGMADFTFDGSSAVAIGLDFTNLTNETTLAAADEFAFYDDGVGMRAITYDALVTALELDLGVDIGNTGEVPYSNTGTPGDNFNYNSGLVFDGTRLIVPQLYVVNSNVAVSNVGSDMLLVSNGTTAFQLDAAYNISYQSLRGASDGAQNLGVGSIVWGYLYVNQITTRTYTTASGRDLSMYAGGSSSATGTHDGGNLTLRGGNQTNATGGDGGNVYMYGGSSIAGTRGEVYFGDGSTFGSLQERTTETQAVYYDIATGLLTYGDGTGLAGAEFTNYGTDTQIPYMVGTTAFDYDAGFTFDDSTYTLRLGVRTYSSSTIQTPSGDITNNDGVSLYLKAGDAYAALGGDGGDIHIIAGNGSGLSSGNAGRVYITPGASSEAGELSAIYLGGPNLTETSVYVIAEASGASANLLMRQKGSASIYFGDSATVSYYIQGTSTASVSIGGNSMTLGVGGVDYEIRSTGYVGGDVQSLSIRGGYANTADFKGGDLIFRGGNAYTFSGNGDGGDIYIWGGDPNGTGSRGQIYFGNGALTGGLEARSTEGNVVYYDTSTGLLTYGDGSGLSGAGFSDYGADTQIPYMNGTTDFAYSDGFTFDDATYTLTVGLKTTTVTNSYIVAPNGTATWVNGGDLHIYGGDPYNTAGADAGDVTIKGGNALSADSGSAAGRIYLVPGNPYQSSFPSYVTLGNYLFSGSSIWLSPEGTQSAINILIRQKGAGNISLGTGGGGGITLSDPVFMERSPLKLGNVGVPLDDFEITGGDGGASHNAGINLIIKGGDGYPLGDTDGGSLYLYGGDPNGAGARGLLYFGDGTSIATLNARTSEGNVVYYDTTTGLLTYGDGTGLSGAGFSDYGADQQIPYMNGTTDFAYSDGFTFDDGTYILNIGDPGVSTTAIKAADGDVTNNHGTALTIKAGDYYDVTGAGGGNLYLKAGDARPTDGGTHGAIYLVPGQGRTGTFDGIVNLGDTVLNTDQITLKVLSSQTNAALTIYPQGSGTLSLGTNNTSFTYMYGSLLNLHHNFVNFGYQNDHVMQGPAGSSSHQNAWHLTIRGGAAYTGDYDGGNLHLYGGTPTGVGSRGLLYFGDGSTFGGLNARTSEGNVVYYDTTTGLLTYGDGTGLSGAGFSDYGADQQIPYMNSTTDFDYTDNFRYDDALYLLKLKGETATNIMIPLISLYNNNSASVGGNNLGVGTSYYLENSAGVEHTAGNVYIEWQSATSTSEFSRFVVSLIKSGAQTNVIYVSGSSATINADALNVGDSGANQQIQIGSASGIDPRIQPAVIFSGDAPDFRIFGGGNLSTTATDDAGHLILAGGNQGGTGGGNGGSVYMYGGTSVSGSAGELYLGTGAAGALSENAAETEVVTYDTATGLLSYRQISGLGSGFSDYGADQQIPYMNSTTDFDYTDNFRYDDSVSTLYLSSATLVATIATPDGPSADARDLDIKAGSGTGTGFDGGNVNIKSGAAYSGDATSLPGEISIVPGNRWESGGNADINIGNTSSTLSAYYFRAISHTSVANVALWLNSKGTGVVNLSSPSGYINLIAGGNYVYLQTTNVIVNTSSNTNLGMTTRYQNNGADLNIIGQSITGSTGDFDGGSIFIRPGTGLNNGADGSIYFGDGTSVIFLEEDVAATEVVTIDTTTGLLSYITASSLGGSAPDYGADMQIPYMNSTTDFDYSAGFLFDDATYTLTIGEKTAADTSSYITAPTGTATYNTGGDLYIRGGAPYDTAGADAGDIIIKAGDARPSDVTSLQGFLYLNSGNHWGSNVSTVYFGDPTYARPSIYVSAAGTSANISLYLEAKGTGTLWLNGNGNGGVVVGDDLDIRGNYISVGTTSIVSTMQHSTEAAFHIVGGGTSVTDGDGFPIYIYGGYGNGSGLRGQVYLGNGSTIATLRENASPTHAVTYNTTTGLLNWTAVGDLGGSGVTLGTAADQIPFMNTAFDDFEYSTTFLFTGTALDIGAAYLDMDAVDIRENATRIFYYDPTNYGIAIGVSALESITTGDYNIAIGEEAFSDQTGTSDGIAIGRYAGRYSTGARNIYLGYNAGSGAVGTNGGYDHIFIGYQAGEDVTSGNGSIAIGYQALQEYASQVQTIAIGYQAARYSTANCNVYIGYQAAMGATTTNTGYDNVIIGRQSGLTISNTNSTVIVGAFAGQELTGISPGNVLLGAYAAQYLNGNYNVAIGYEAGKGTTTVSVGDNNVFVGYRAGYAMQDGARNIAMGDQALSSNTAGDYNIAIGRVAGQYLLGTNNIAIGQFTGQGDIGLTSTASHNIFVGFQAGQYVTTGGYNIAIGYTALQDNLTGADNIAIGRGALANTTGSGYNVAVGNNACNIATSLTGVTAVGWEAGQNATGNYNSYFGVNSGESTGSSAGNTGYGYYSLRNSTGGYNTAVGYNAMSGVTGTAQYNVAVGSGALDSIGDGNYNTSIGGNSGGSISDGTNNVVIGYGSAPTTSTGSYNIIIGTDIYTTAAGTSYQFRLGYSTTFLLEGDMTTSQQWVGTTYDFRTDILDEFTTDAGITVNANVGIGAVDTTYPFTISNSTGPKIKLVLDSATDTGDPSINFYTGTSGGTQVGVVGYNYGENDIRIVYGTSINNTTGIIVDHLGRVGIGGNPFEELHIYGDSATGEAASLEFQNTNTGISAGAEAGRIKFWKNDISGEGAGVVTTIYSVANDAGSTYNLYFSTGQDVMTPAGTNSTMFLGYTGNFEVDAAQDAYLTLNGASTYDSAVLHQVNGTTQVISGWDTSASIFQIHTGTAFVTSATGDFSINASGNVFMANITNTTSGNYLYYDSTTKELTYNTTSDIRLKDVLGAWEPDSLGFLRAQDIIRFNWKDGKGYNQIGWNANQMSELMPELTWKDEHGYWNYYDAHMRFHFHRAIKQLDETVETHEQRIKRLESRIEELEEQLNIN